MAFAATFLLAIGLLLVGVGCFKVNIASQVGQLYDADDPRRGHSRAAPRQIQGLMIGVYYTSFFLCNVAVGRPGGMLEQMDPAAFWLMHAGIVGTSAFLLAAVAVWGRRVLMPATA